MKKLLLSFAMLLAFVGCSDDGGTTTNDDGSGTPSTPVTPDTEDVVYTASLESPEGLTLAWPEKAVIAVFRSARNEKFEYTGEENKFKKVDKTKPSTAVPTVYGVYPRKSTQKISSTGSLTMALPDGQTYNPTGIDFEINPMVAAGEDIESTELPFKNMCGYLCVKAYGEIPPVKEIVISGRDKELLAGAVEVVPQYGAAPEYTLATGSEEITLSCSEAVTLGTTAETATSFYFIVAPNTLSKGLSITFVDAEGNEITERLDPEVVIRRNELTTLEPVEVIKEAVSDVIFDVEFAMDGKATDKGRFGLEIVKKTDANGNTPYMEVYRHPQFQHNNIVRYNKAFMNGEHMSDSYYYAILSNEFNEAVADGCTIEFVASQPYISYDAFSRIFSTEAYGFMQRGYSGSGAFPYSMISGGDQWGNNTIMNVTPAPEPNTFYHYMLSWDAMTQAWSVYRNGRFVGVRDGVVLDSSVYLGIGGWPQGGNPDRLTQCFMGDIALLRFYDSVYTEEQVLERYTALNIPQNAVSDYYVYEPMVDLHINEDGSADNKGALQSAVVETVKNSNGQTPGLSALMVGDKRVASFSRPLDADSKEIDIAEDSYYKISGSDFLQKINDGSFSVEIIAAGQYKTPVTPISSEAFRLGMLTGVKGYRPYYRLPGDGVFSENYYGSRVSVESNEYFHYIVTYDKFQATVTAFYDGQTRDENAGTWAFNTFLGGFNEAYNVYVGANINAEGVLDQRFDGKIASLRIYDEPLHGYKARNLIEKRKAEVAALNAAAGVVVAPPAPYANVKFELDGSATETLKDFEVETVMVGEGGPFEVTAPATESYTLNNVVYMYQGQDTGDNFYCYKIDLTQNDELLKVLNSEFTFEIIHAAPHTNKSWAGLFGTEGCSMLRLAGYKYKWNSNARTTVPNWPYQDGDVAPTANQWYHTIFTYDATSQTFSVYRDGALDMKNGVTEKNIGGEMWQNSNLVIGARYGINMTREGEAWDSIYNSWCGSIALFRIYDKRVSPRQVQMLYNDVRPQISALNEANAQ